MLLLPNIVSSEGLFRYGNSISKYVVLGQFPYKHFVCYLAVSALIVLRALGNLLEYFLKSF